MIGCTDQGGQTVRRSSARDHVVTDCSNLYSLLRSIGNQCESTRRGCVGVGGGGGGVT